MAAFAATDVTYSIIRQSHDKDSRNANLVKLTFGNATLTYAAGGIPLLKANMGCPNNLESAMVVDSGTSGYIFTVDVTNSKLVMKKAPASTSVVLIEATSDAPAAVSVWLEVVGY